MFRLFLLIFLSYFSIIQVQAKGCKRVNLLTRKWGMFPRQMPLYDQGRSHICYAYAAAQMVDYWRETHGGKIGKMKMGQSSPLYAALLTRLVYAPNDRYKNSFDDAGGDTYDTLIGIRKYGMCQEHKVKEAMNSFAIKNNIDPTEFLIETEKYFSYHKETERTLWGSAWSTIGSLRQHYGPGNLSLKKIQKVMKPYTSGGNYMGFLKDVFKGCFGKENIYLKSLKMPYPKRVWGGNISKVYWTIRKLLEKKDNPQPVGIGYCSRILTKKGFRGVNVASDTGEVQPRMGCRGHASIIVGQRERGGTCQFLIRNTWGNDCHVYKPAGWECKKDKNGKAAGVWVDAKELSYNVLSVYYL
ncbi:hypothetical protein OAK75_13740 [Bacteriovoracales bacterium]|nr:hypothetical protein [Bacteriovoracales bacterium]